MTSQVELCIATATANDRRLRFDMLRLSGNYVREPDAIPIEARVTEKRLGDILGSA